VDCYAGDKHEPRDHIVISKKALDVHIPLTIFNVRIWVPTVRDSRQ
jgi:hypothetical protein